MATKGASLVLLMKTSGEPASSKFEKLEGSQPYVFFLGEEKVQGRYELDLGITSPGVFVHAYRSGIHTTAPGGRSSTRKFSYPVVSI